LGVLWEVGAVGNGGVGVAVLNLGAVVGALFLGAYEIQGIIIMLTFELPEHSFLEQFVEKVSSFLLVFSSLLLVCD
jgi:hypothetical protein